MEYITKNINKLLLVFVIIFIVVIAGLVVFFSLNFKAINDDYNTKISELNNTYTALVNYQSALNQTQSELDIKTQREQGLSVQYVDVKSQKDSLQVERDALKTERNKLQENLTATTNNYNTVNALYISINSSFYTQVKEIDALRMQVSSLQGQVAQCGH